MRREEIRYADGMQRSELGPSAFARRFYSDGLGWLKGCPRPHKFPSTLRNQLLVAICSPELKKVRAVLLQDEALKNGGEAKLESKALISFWDQSPG